MKLIYIMEDNSFDSKEKGVEGGYIWPPQAKQS
jgi:hypothetical protein